MKRNRVFGSSPWIVGSMLLTMLLCTLASVPSMARSSLAIDQKVFEKMQEVQLLIEAEQYAEADTQLNELFERKRLNNYEKAQILTMKGNVAYQQDKIDAAIDLFKAAVEYKDLPAGFLLATTRTVAQLSFMQDELEQALFYANKVNESIDVPDASLHVLFSQIYYKKDSLTNAMAHIKKAIEIESAQGQQPAENWLLILNAIYYGLGDYQNMIGVLKELIRLYPKQQYVTNLAAIYGQLEMNDKQLLLLEPLYDQGRLRQETELINLANLMVLYKVPYKGAKIIEQGFRDGSIKRSKRNLELLAQSWLLAAEDERSVEYLAEAAELSEEGMSYLQLAQTHIGLYHWQAAEEALEKSLKLGGLEAKEGDAWLLLGMVRFYQKDYRRARKAFREASEVEGMDKLANQWITFMEQEREKEEAAQESTAIN